MYASPASKKATAAELAGEDLHGTRPHLDVVGEDVRAHEEVGRVPAQAVVSTEKIDLVQVISPPVEKGPVDDDATDPGDRGRYEVCCRLQSGVGDALILGQLGLGRGLHEDAEQPVTHGPRVLRGAVEAQHVA